MSDVPRTTLVRHFDTHRLIPAKYAQESVLTKLVDEEDDLRNLFDLDHVTNARLLAEHGREPSLDVRELVVGVPQYQIVNAAFCHPHPNGSRFNGNRRAAWYAAFELEAAQTEVAHHKAIELAEIGGFDMDVDYTDYLADFSASMHDIRDDPRFAECLDPASYVASQALAEGLLELGSLGVVYPSVRHAGGNCLACFRPALVSNVRRDATYRFRWRGCELERTERLES